MAPLNWDNIEIIAEDESIVRITDWSRVEIVSEDGDLIKTCDNDVYNIEACDRMIVFSGQPGADGPQGPAATIRVGTVTTLPAGSDATVVNRGTPEAAIFDFGIPKGADGASEWGDIGGTLSDQTDLQNALNAKANTADLGTMSAENTSDYYTKSATDALLLDKAPVILNSASGSVASFTDGSPAPVTALTVGIEPVQNLHGYDHPWPAGSGANIMPMIKKGTYTGNGITVVVGDDNLITVSGTKDTNSAVTIPLPYETSGQMGFVGYRIHCRNTSAISGTRIYWSSTSSGYQGLSSINVISAANGTEREFQTAAMYFGTGIASGTEVSMVLQPSFELADTTTDWTPYSNICPISGHTEANIYHEAEYDADADPTVTIDLDGTRYSGTLNVLTGEMTVDRVYRLVTSDLDWKKSTNYQGSYYLSNANTEGLIPNFVQYSKMYCSHAKNVTQASDYVNGTCILSNSLNIWILDSNSTLNDWKDFLDNNSVEICAEINPPQTVQLTPAQLSTLLGTNNIWADTGDVEVEYRADTKLFIETLTKPTEDDMVANTNIASGKYFMVGANKLFVSTQSIANGEKIVPGTNCTAMSLADALNAINA